MSGTLMAGFARRETTPPKGLRMDGYQARRGTAVGVLDPLHVRACFLQAGDTACILLCLECLGIGGRFFDQVRRSVADSLAVPAEGVIVAATHTHSGPYGFIEPSHVSAELHNVQRTLEVVLEAATAARENAVPAAAGFQAANCRGVAASRLHSNQRVDQRVRSLRFVSTATGALLGAISNFACHPTILGAGNLHYSGDLHGRAAAIVEEDMGVTCLLTNGAEGELSTRFTRRRQDTAEVTRLGRLLAAAVKETLESPVASEVDSRLGLSRRTVTLPLRDLGSERDTLAMLEEAERTFAEAAPLPSGEKRRLWTRLEGARIQHQRRQQGIAPGAAVEATCTAVHVGPASLVTIPGELFSSALTPATLERACLAIGLANGYLGYFPTARAFSEQSYEALSSPFNHHAATVIGRCLEALAREARAA